jgi:putative serine protease PepD
MLPDDDGDEDAPVFGTPLPPDDRLWRHPSEVGKAADTKPATTADGARHPRVWSIAVVSGLVGAVLTVGVVAAAGGLHEKVIDRPAALEKVAVNPQTTLAAFSAAGGSSSAVVAVTHAVAPAVVRLQVTSPTGVVTGSGVLYRTDGYLLTNAHLLDGAQSVAVVLADGSALDGAIIGSDGWTDVAVVHVDRDGLTTATLGSTKQLQVGQQAIAIGAPLDDSSGPSVSVGVISSLDRKVQSTAGTWMHDMLATDARFGREASGGALVDSDGSVIGLTTIVSSDAADTPSMTLSYATPIEVATAVADDIIATGKAHHAWLGVEGYDMSLAAGALVSKVADGSPAATAGLQGGDVITGLDGQPVSSMSALVTGLRGHAPGDTVSIDYTRGSDHRSCHATLDEKDQP